MSSTQSSDLCRASAYEAIIVSNRGEIPATGVAIVDLLPGTAISEHTLKYFVRKLSMHFSENYAPADDKGNFKPNRVTEIIDEARRRGWTHERACQTLDSWLFSEGAKFEKWRPSEIINHKMGETLMPHSWISTLERNERFQVEGFWIGGYPLYRMSDGRDLAKEYGFKQHQFPAKSEQVDKSADKSRELPIGMPDDVKKMLEEFKNESNLGETQDGSQD